MASDKASSAGETTPLANPSESAKTGQNLTAVGNFFVGAGLSAIAVLTLLGISLWTTHTALSQVEPLEIAILLAIPLGCGGLAFFFKKQFIEALSAVLSVLPL